MNKTELINHMAEEAGITKAQAAAALKGFEDAVKNVLCQGDSLSLVGFGTFSVGERAERQGRNPQTGEAITIAAAKTVKFKAGKALKDVVNA